MAQLVYELKKALLIDSKAFSRASAAQQTEAVMKASGRPVVFSEDIANLKSKTRLRNLLLEGKDASIELELQNITLSEEELLLLDKVRPIFERVCSVGKYEWMSGEFTPSKHLNLYDDRILREGYTVNKTSCSRIWTFASKKWLNDEGYDKTLRLRVTGYDRELVVSRQGIVFGCHSLSRQEVEYIAKHFGFEEPLE